MRKPDPIAPEVHVSTKTRNPNLAALMREPGANPIRDFFDSGRGKSYGPASTEKVKENLELLLSAASDVDHVTITIVFESPEYFMMVHLLMHWTTSSQLSRAAGRKITMEIDLEFCDYVFRFGKTYS